MMIADNRPENELQRRLHAWIRRESSERMQAAMQELVPQLAALLDEHKSSPDDQVRPLVWRVVKEHIHVDEGGDAMEHEQGDVDQLAELVMRHRPRNRSVVHEPQTDA